ncbi:short-chain dehydrogenase/reductase SDR [Lactarius psammicola]|nr:short-chain dehydrogenase/reductase SDR [Lactarius psammicola]
MSGLTVTDLADPPSLAMALATTRVALVTGAVRGIGRAIALCLANCGLDVTVNHRSSSPELNGLVREIESKGRRSLAVPADISLEPDVEMAIRKVVQDPGSLDVVVANAGIICFELFLDTRELGKYGITVNAYAPGIVETPLAAQLKARFGPDALSCVSILWNCTIVGFCELGSEARSVKARARDQIRDERTMERIDRE